ncbi:hypothetical protein [Salinibaculum rarum]|uniref:hypothetical protein n=1 Tax=Salinibaculum rarum TaxID=3058903 RepID=UPI00265EF110|nr:hypothetical protein [Salinibaculum sp. KK48]
MFVDPHTLDTARYPSVTPDEKLSKPVAGFEHVPFTIEHVRTVNEFLDRVYRLYRGRADKIEMDDTGVAKINDTGQAVFDTDENPDVMDFWDHTTTLYQVTAASRLTDRHALDLSIPEAPELRGVDETPVLSFDVRYRPPEELRVTCEYRVLSTAPTAYTLFDETIDEWVTQPAEAWWDGLYEHIIETLVTEGAYSRAAAAGFAYYFFPPLRATAGDDIITQQQKNVTGPLDPNIKDDIEYILTEGIPS